MRGHTPGPWTAEDCRVLAAGQDIAVCIAWDRNDTPLIAAAPDLLETLKAVAPLIDSIDAMLEGWNGPKSKSPLGPMVRAAIAKAELR